MNRPPNEPGLFGNFKDCHLLVLKMIQGCAGLDAAMIKHHVTCILQGARDDIKYSPHAIILLIDMQLVDMKLLDEFLAEVWSSDIIFGDTSLNTFSHLFYLKMIKSGQNVAALSCCIKLVNTITSVEKRKTSTTAVRSS